MKCVGSPHAIRRVTKEESISAQFHLLRAPRAGDRQHPCRGSRSDSSPDPRRPAAYGCHASTRCRREHAISRWGFGSALRPACACEAAVHVHHWPPRHRDTRRSMGPICTRHRVSAGKAEGVVLLDVFVAPAIGIKSPFVSGLWIIHRSPADFSQASRVIPPFSVHHDVARHICGFASLERHPCGVKHVREIERARRPGLSPAFQRQTQIVETMLPWPALSTMPSTKDAMPSRPPSCPRHGGCA